MFRPEPPARERPRNTPARRRQAALVRRAKPGARGLRRLMHAHQRLFRVARSVRARRRRAEDVRRRPPARACRQAGPFPRDAAILTGDTHRAERGPGRLRGAAPRSISTSSRRPRRRGPGSGLPADWERGSEFQAARAEIRRLLEHAIDELPSPSVSSHPARVEAAPSMRPGPPRLRPETGRPPAPRPPSAASDPGRKVSASLTGAFPSSASAASASPRPFSPAWPSLPGRARLAGPASRNRSLAMTCRRLQRRGPSRSALDPVNCGRRRRTTGLALSQTGSAVGSVNAREPTGADRAPASRPALLTVRGAAWVVVDRELAVP